MATVNSQTIKHGKTQRDETDYDFECDRRVLKLFQVLAQRYGDGKGLCHCKGSDNVGYAPQFLFHVLGVHDARADAA
jgi:hypothetical protein